jgi:O-antigen/teichoic acid export membrane protein
MRVKLLQMHKPKMKKFIKNLNKPGGNLSQSTVRGGLWMFALRTIQQLFGLVRLVILARILAPHDFGLMGIALLTMATLDTFSQTGFQVALIQKKKNIKPYLDSAWTVIVLRGLVLFGILYLIAPYAAIFFNTLEAKPIIQVIGVVVLLQAFSNIGVIYFQKELEFDKQFVYQLSGTLADFIVAVSAALILRNVWALVFGLLAGNVVRFVMSYLIHPYRPHLSFDLRKAKELFGFGKWALGSSILMFLIIQGDDAFVIKFLSVTMLGFYQMAYRISNMPATEITHVISQVTFPAYSKMQNDIPTLREAYLKVLKVTAFLSFPIAGLIFVLAPDFTMVFLGEKWMPMVPAMQVLVFWGLIRSIGATTGPIIYATGRPKILTKYQFLQLIMVIVFIYPFTMYWGIFGTSLAVLFASIGGNAPAIYKVIKITNCGSHNFLRAIIFPLTSSLVAIVSVFLLKTYWIFPKVLLIPFVLSLIFYGLVYFGVTYLFDRFAASKIRHLVKDLFLTSRGL